MTPPDLPRADARLHALPAERAQCVLDTLRRVQVATKRQMLFHHWVAATPSRSGEYGYRLLRKLEAGGEVVTERLHPEEGSTSPEVVALAPAGPGQDSAIALVRARDQLRVRLQYTETVLHREREGWSFALPSAGAEERLRDAVMADWQTRDGAEAVQAIFRLGRVAQLPGASGVLHRDEDGALRARALLYVAHPDQAHAAVAQLPDPALVRTLDVEVVVGADEHRAAVRAALAARYGAAGVPVVMHGVAPFTERPNPRLSRADLTSWVEAVGPHAPRPPVPDTPVARPATVEPTPVDPASTPQPKRGLRAPKEQLGFGF